MLGLGLGLRLAFSIGVVFLALLRNVCGHQAFSIIKSNFTSVLPTLLK